MNTTTKIYKERSETIANEIKGFDTMLQARIFEKLSAAQGVTFADSDLEDAIVNYIAVTRPITPSRKISITRKPGIPLSVTSNTRNGNGNV
jgi:hypothetical protein